MADKKSTRFTFDSENEGASVPTLTSLLYRRNSVKTASSPLPTSLDVTRTNIGEMATGFGGVPATTEEAQSNEDDAATRLSSLPSDSPAIVQSGFSPSTAPASSPTTGQPIGRVVPAVTPLAPRSLLQSQEMESYPPSALAAQVLRSLQEKAKLRSSLLFEADASGTKFVLKSIVGKSEWASDRTSAWSGMEISIQEFSDLWGRLKKFGFAEFSTLGAAGQGNYDRTAFRSAFQATAQEWLTLARYENAGKESILAFLSEGSLQTQLPALLSSGQTAAQGVRKVA